MPRRNYGHFKKITCAFIRLHHEEHNRMTIETPASKPDSVARKPIGLKQTCIVRGKSVINSKIDPPYPPNRNLTPQENGSIYAQSIFSQERVLKAVKREQFFFVFVASLMPISSDVYENPLPKRFLPMHSIITVRYYIGFGP